MKEAIILAAGESTRLRPLTSTRPKPMLAVAGKPMLQWTLEAISTVGIKNVCLVVGYKKDVIEAYFGSRFNGLKLEYVLQEEQLGTAHAVATVNDKVNGEFLVINGDVLVFPKLVKSFVESHRYDASMCLIEVSDPTQYGIVELKRGVVKSLEEKPKKPKSSLGNAGLYIFNEGIFDIIEKVEKSKRLEYELTDAIKFLLKEGKVNGFRFKEPWIDIGRPWDLLDANEIVMQKRKLKQSRSAKIEKYAVIKGLVHLGDNTTIRSGSYIEGPCFIGDNCTIGPNCFIRPYSAIYDGCRIGNAVEIKNSIVMSNSTIGHLSYVGDSIIGENCNFGAGTKVANLRFDNAEIKVEIKTFLQGSGRRKFGCIMGDNVKTGINVSIMPGRAIYPNAVIEAGSVVRNTIYTE